MSHHGRIGTLLVVVIVVVALAAIASRSVMERSAVGSNVIFTQDYTLSNTVDHPVVVVASNSINLTNDSHVDGDAALVGKSAVTINGQVDGDLSALGDSVEVGSDSHVDGDAALMGGAVTLDGDIEGDLTVVGDSLTVNPDAQINGDITACVKTVTDNRSDAEVITDCSQAESGKFAALQSLRDGHLPFNDLGGMAAGGFNGGGLLSSALVSLGLTGLAVLAVVAFPRRFSYLMEAVQSRPGSMAGMGCLTVLLAVGGSAIILVLLAHVPVLGLLLLPVAAILGVILLGMVIMGWITLALVIGSWMVNRMGNGPVPPLIAVALGSVVLFILRYVLGLLPFGGLVDFILIAILGLFGLGAAFVTRLGTRPVRQRYFVQG